MTFLTSDRKRNAFNKSKEDETNLNRILRRDFLRFCGRTGILASSMPFWAELDFLTQNQIAQAQTVASNDHRFVFIWIEGGWDTSSASEVKDRSTGEFDLDYGMNDAVSAGSLLVPPAMATLARNHKDIMCLVNGIHMATSGHVFATDEMTSGFIRDNQSTNPSIQTILAYETDRNNNYLIPNLAVRLKPTLGAGIPSQFGAAIEPDPSKVYSLLAQDFADMGKQSVLSSIQTSQAMTSRFLSRLRNTSQTAKVGPYQTKQEQTAQIILQDKATELRISNELRERYFPNGRTDSIGAQCALAFLGIKTGIVKVVTLGTGGFDTHRDHYPVHTNRVREVLDTIDKLVTDLKGTPAPGGGSLMDNTTILVMNEFSRTARLNNISGKDHADVNSVIALGKGVNAAGGQGLLLGSSSANASYSALPVDFETGDFQNGTLRQITPKHFLATLVKLAGGDPARYFSNLPVVTRFIKSTVLTAFILGISSPVLMACGDLNDFNSQKKESEESSISEEPAEKKLGDVPGSTQINPDGSRQSTVKVESSSGVSRPIAGEASWSRDVKPLFDRFCKDCHGLQTYKSSFAHFQLETYDAWVTLADVVKTRAILLSDNPMPRSGNIEKSYRDVMQQWIDDGKKP
jgi:hypothetical protein